MLQHLINNTLGNLGYNRIAAVSVLMLAFVAVVVALLMLALRVGGDLKQ